MLLMEQLKCSCTGCVGKWLHADDTKKSTKDVMTKLPSEYIGNCAESMAYKEIVWIFTTVNSQKWASEAYVGYEHLDW